MEGLNIDEFEKYTWNVIESYFKEVGGKMLINLQVQSFNDFVLNKLEEIIRGFNTIEVYHKLNYASVLRGDAGGAT